MKRFLIAIFGLLVASVSAQVIPVTGTQAAAPTSSIVGQLQTATGGPVNNGTLTFVLSQPAVVSGSSTLTGSAVSCYTDNNGSVVGIPNPLTPPTASTFGGGTLPNGTYFAYYTYWAPGTESIASPEVTFSTLTPGSVLFPAPTLQPSSASGWRLYIGTSSGGETLQFTITGWHSYTQATPLVTGAVAPIANNSVCNIYFSDQLVPTGTYYTVSLTNKNGSPISGYPQTWCTYGGAGGTINVSNGVPTGNCNVNGVFYPTPLFQTASYGGLNQSLGTNLTLGSGLTLTSPFISSTQVTVTNVGAYNGIPGNQYIQSLLGGINLDTEFTNSCIGCNMTTDAISGGIAMPSGASTDGGNGVSGYCVSNADSRIGGVPGQVANCTAMYGHSRAIANGAAVWGFNPQVYDTAGISGDSIVGSEYDLGVFGSPSVFEGIDFIYGTHGSGVWPASAAVIAMLNKGTTPIPNAIVLGQNAAVGGMQLYPACAATGTETCNSMPILFRGTNSGTQIQSQVNGDNLGNVLLSPANNADSVVVTAGNLGFNNNKGQHIYTKTGNDDIAGTCIVASGTTCSIVFATNYTFTPSCSVTPTSNAGAYYLSAQANTGFTITYASSGAQSFNYLCIGNPN